jgi:hypothetical protein
MTLTANIPKSNSKSSEKKENSSSFSISSHRLLVFSTLPFQEYQHYSPPGKFSMIMRNPSHLNWGP